MPTFSGTLMRGSASCGLYERPGIRLYTDEDVDTRLAEQLQRRGYDVLSCRDANRHLQGIDDEDQLAFAARHGRTILVHNVDDYARRDQAWKTEGREHRGILAVQNGRPIGALVRRVHAYLDTTTPPEAYSLLQFLPVEKDARQTALLGGVSGSDDGHDRRAAAQYLAATREDERASIALLLAKRVDDPGQRATGHVEAVDRQEQVAGPDGFGDGRVIGVRHTGPPPRRARPCSSRRWHRSPAATSGAPSPVGREGIGRPSSTRRRCPPASRRRCRRSARRRAGSPTTFDLHMIQ